MLKRVNWLVVLVLVMISIFSTVYSNADSGLKPGSADDPLVTKSYLDQYIKGGNMAQGIKPDSSVPSASSPNSASTNITVIKLEPGQMLFAGAGSEFIVRTGKVLVVSTDENGVPDVTSGKDLAPNAAVELNHLLVFPREGRGIKPDPKNAGDIYVMVKGNYLLVNDASKK